MSLSIQCDAHYCKGNSCDTYASECEDSYQITKGLKVNHRFTKYKKGFNLNFRSQPHCEFINISEVISVSDLILLTHCSEFIIFITTLLQICFKLTHHCAAGSHASKTDLICPKCLNRLSRSHCFTSYRE